MRWYDMIWPLDQPDVIIAYLWVLFASFHVCFFFQCILSDCIKEFDLHCWWCWTDQDLDFDRFIHLLVWSFKNLEDLIKEIKGMGFRSIFPSLLFPLVLVGRSCRHWGSSFSVHCPLVETGLQRETQMRQMRKHGKRQTIGIDSSGSQSVMGWQH